MIEIYQREGGKFLSDFMSLLADIKEDGGQIRPAADLFFYGSLSSGQIVFGGENLTYSSDELVGGTITVISSQPSPESGFAMQGVSLTAKQVTDLLDGKPAAFLDQLQNSPWEYRGSAYNDDVVAGNLNDDIDGRAGNDVLRGGAGSDVLHGGTGADQLFGDTGVDVLSGDEGADLLRGGSGADRFEFSALSHSTASASGRDLILDFNRGQDDKIDLARMDANTTLADDQAFSFIGKAAFSGKAGELRYGITGEITTISGDVNGDGVADFRVSLDRSLAMVASDFLL